MLKVQSVLDEISPAQVPPLLKKLRDSAILLSKDMYSVFTFENLRKLGLRVSKMLKSDSTSFVRFAT